MFGLEGRTFPRIQQTFFFLNHFSRLNRNLINLA